MSSLLSKIEADEAAPQSGGAQPSYGQGLGGSAPLPAAASPLPPTPAVATGGRVAVGLSHLKVATDLAACVAPLLEALNWRGDPRHVAESVPHFIDSLDITSFRNILAHLHFESRPLDISLGRIDPRNMPCLFLPRDGEALVLLGLEKDGIRVFDGGKAQFDVVPRRSLPGTAYFFTRIDEEDLVHQTRTGWFKSVTDRFVPLVYQAFGLTFILNLLALVTPLFIMAVYDKVIATGSMGTLAYLSIGVGIAIACDMVLRGLRAKILAFVGARLDTLVGSSVFQKILFLPPAFTERAAIGAQVARIKDFENVREFFTGPMALVFFEAPFVIIFIAVIASLGGSVAVVPVIMVVLFVICGAVMAPFVRQAVSKGARYGSRKQEFSIEALNSMRAIKYCGAERIWLARYRDLSAKASLAGYRTAEISAINNTISHVLMISAGTSTVAYGVFKVFDASMTMGGLVASMMLVWRVLAPLQTGFLTLTRLTQVRSSINQINNLMNLKAERQTGAEVRPVRRIRGRVTFSRVSLRYSPESDPALVGVSFDVEPGQVVCVVGGNGSGKSTILKLLIGMYGAQAGGIRLDDMDIRQMDPIELRYTLAYAPQVPQFFYGTIAQNMRLAVPTATDADLHWAADQAGVLQDILAMEQGSGKWKRSGFEVRIGDTGQSQMPASFMQRLNLARAYLKRSPVMLFDEPGNNLDFDSDKLFMRRVEEMKGQTTSFIVTHRPSHLKIADLIIWLDGGHLRAFGPAAEVRAQMPKDFL
ncbi:MAG: ABC transporter transmembrane domain-containing protein [Magnetospirillum sp. WYHS-4]